MTKQVTYSSVTTWKSPVNPTQSETEVLQGNFWLNTTSGATFVCVDPTFGSQVWLETGGPVRTFIPTVAGSVTPGIGTYTVQEGFYARNAHNIFSCYHVSWTNHTGTGDLTLTGQPSKFLNSPNYGPIGATLLEDIHLGNFSGMVGQGSPGTSVITIYGIRSNASKSPIPMSTSGTIHLTMSYLS